MRMWIEQYLSWYILFLKMSYDMVCKTSQIAPYVKTKRQIHGSHQKTDIIRMKTMAAESSRILLYYSTFNIVKSC